MPMSEGSGVQKQSQPHSKLEADLGDMGLFYTLYSPTSTKKLGPNEK